MGGPESRRDRKTERDGAEVTESGSVPEATADHWEGTVADGTESCSSDSQ